ncbi:hypothetical protein DFAR_3900013 [Desulfarculales bacterium]
MDFMYRGEMCMAYKIRSVETNRQGAFSNTNGNCSVLGESVFFGDEAVARIEALAPHLRLSANYQGRFGTKQAAAWYAILAYGSVWNTANDGEAKIIRLGSAILTGANAPTCRRKHYVVRRRSSCNQPGE